MSFHKIKEDFESHLVPVEFYICDIYNNIKHPLHNRLMNDLKNFKINDLESFKNNNTFEDCPLDDEVLNLFSKKIRYEILKDRINYLRNNSNRPYENPDFKDLIIDKNKLVSINDFECKIGG